MAEGKKAPVKKVAAKKTVLPEKPLSLTAPVEGTETDTPQIQPQVPTQTPEEPKVDIPTEENTENTSEYTSEEATSKEIPTTAAVPTTEAEKTTVQATTENPFVNPMTDLVVGLLGTNTVAIAFTPVSGI